MLGPFVRSVPVYTLSFADAEGAFSIGAHLGRLSDFKVGVLGLDAEQQNLVALCANPKSGSSRVRHGMTATITPDFDGLAGSFTYKARPDGGFIAVTKAVGRAYYGEFHELPTSASSGWLTWTRTRRARVGTQPDTKAPIFETQTEAVQIQQLTERGDQTGDFTNTTASALAVAQTLRVGDVLTREGESYVVVSILPQGQYERAELSLRSY